LRNITKSNKYNYIKSKFEPFEPIGCCLLKMNEEMNMKQLMDCETIITESIVREVDGLEILK